MRFSKCVCWFISIPRALTKYILPAAACMTLELAESGNAFITSVINGADLVPTFSAASVDDLRAEVLFLSSVICSDIFLPLRS